MGSKKHRLAGRARGRRAWPGRLTGAGSSSSRAAGRRSTSRYHTPPPSPPPVLSSPGRPAAGGTRSHRRLNMTCGRGRAAGVACGYVVTREVA